MTAEPETHAVVERVARESYGRLVAFLAARSGDVASAEDALGDAFHAALETWPRAGVPANPEAWLLTSARRRLIDRARHAQVQADAVPHLLAMTDEAHELLEAGTQFPDERLKLLFICTHPAIEASVRTPLMLQTVLGLDAARIASAFVVRPAAMGQRLSRAKAKIRDARIAFDVPEPDALPARLDAVLEAVYAAYGSAWDDVAGADARRKGLGAEALELGTLLVRFLPDEPEAQGLLALMLYCEARRAERRTAGGAYVPLSAQDPTRWSLPMIDEAERILLSASRAKRIGRFQLEAAIQSVHAQRLRSGATDWGVIAELYEALTRLAPTIGALVGRAAAIGEVHGAAAGWESLERIPGDQVANYQPHWALAARLLKRLERSAESRAAYTRAIGLSEDGAVRAFLTSEASNA